VRVGFVTNGVKPLSSIIIWLVIDAGDYPHKSVCN
jgi:hypothetical protein